MEAALGVLSTAVDAFCGYIEGLPAEALVDKAWGPKEVLAHILYWQEVWVAEAEAVLAGRPYSLPEGRFEDVNSEVARASHGVPVDDLLSCLRAVQERLRRVASEPGAGDILLQLKMGAAQQPLEWLILGEAEHIRDHQRTLERQAGRDAVAEAEALRQAVEDLCGFAAGLPGERCEARVMAGLAHLALCFQALEAQVEAVQAGEPFALPQGDALEAQVAALAKRATMDELLVRLWASAQQLGRYGQTLDPQQVVLEVWRLQLSRGSTFRTLDDCLRWLEAEVRKRHREWQRQWAG